MGAFGAPARLLKAAAPQPPGHWMSSRGPRDAPKQPHAWWVLVPAEDTPRRASDAKRPEMRLYAVGLLLVEFLQI